MQKNPEILYTAVCSQNTAQTYSVLNDIVAFKGCAKVSMPIIIIIAIIITIIIIISAFYSNFVKYAYFCKTIRVCWYNLPFVMCFPSCLPESMTLLV